MGMTRVHAADYLAGTLTQLWEDAFPGRQIVDEPGLLLEIIDDALLMVGTDYGDLATAEVANEDVLGFRKVLSYAGLLRLYDAILNRVDFNISSPGVSESRSQFVKQMENRIRMARDAAEPFIADSGQWGAGTLSFDYLEPVAS